MSEANVAVEIENYVNDWFEKNWNEVCTHRETAEKMWQDGICATFMIRETLDRMKATDDIENRKALFFLIYKTYLGKVTNNDRLFLKVLTDFKDFWTDANNKKKLVIDLGSAGEEIDDEIEKWKLTRAS